MRNIQIHFLKKCDFFEVKKFILYYKLNEMQEEYLKVALTTYQKSEFIYAETKNIHF